MIYFGTDGIRGIVGEDLTQEISLKCGNALARLAPNAKIVIGRDTRPNGSFLLSGFVCGATMGGANVVDVGIVPTPAISFLVQKLGADFGVMITASHNPPEYNGIKIFDSEGKKIDVKTEIEVERNFAKQHQAKKLGTYSFNKKLAKLYENHIIQSVGIDLSGLSVVVDCSNGASSFVAKKVFKRLGAKVKTIFASANGDEINHNCGALHPQKLAQCVKKLGADVGFAFDGDADRIVAVDQTGKTIDGDQILLFLLNMYKKFGLLKSKAIVGTIQTNMAVELYLKSKNFDLIRTDVGDKFVTDALLQNGLQLGGEQSGHIILTEHTKTGDALLCAVQICKFLSKLDKPLSNHIFNGLLPQFSKNYLVADKYAVINSVGIKNAISQCEQLLIGKGRVVVRASGTEPKIRVMIETKNQKLANQIFAIVEKCLV